MLYRILTFAVGIGLFAELHCLFAQDPGSVIFPPVNQQIQGIVMELMAPKDMVELAHRIQAAIKRFPDLIKQDTAGTSLPIDFDSRLGITYDEYQHFIKLSATGIRLHPSSNVVLTFKKLPNGDMEIETLLKMPIDGVKLSPNLITTSYGNLAKKYPIDNQNRLSPTGPWKGIGWKLEEIDAESRSVKLVQFHLGNLQNGRGILYYVVRFSNVPNQEDKNLNFLVYFDMPANSKKED